MSRFAGVVETLGAASVCYGGFLLADWLGFVMVGLVLVAGAQAVGK